MKAGTIHPDLQALATLLRQELENRKYILLYAYNGTGKTRLSMAFKELGKKDDERDTLYFNAFTEDLFTWDNDLEDDSDRRLLLNRQSRFFAGIKELEMDNRIRPLLQRYSDFDFRIDTEERCVRFSRTVEKTGGDGTASEIVDNIKVSRGEENIFIWCFFMAIVELAMDKEVDAYKWVKFVYIDDPISSLDEHNAIAVANHLAQLLKKSDHDLKTVISTHHTLFFLGCGRLTDSFVLTETGDTPFFQHVALLAELDEAAKSGELYTYHFNILRTILEKTASFHGFKKFGDCITQDMNDPDGVLHARIINIMSHGNYSLFEPQEMLEENKGYFRKILSDFKARFPFNPELFKDEHVEA
jgi:hypothetical protein